MTHGTPVRGTRLPRLRLHTMTRRAPATPATTMVSKVMLSGGALRPWARRRVLRVMVTSA